MQKLEWKQPVLEMIEVSVTMGGPNGVYPDKNGKGGNNGHAHQIS